MFRKGDYIIYGSTGICKVEEIGVPKLPHVSSEKLYYTLAPVYSTETIYTPVDTDTFMRPIISRRDAELLIEQIPYIRENIYINRNQRFLAEHYKASLDTHNCEDLVELIKSVYLKNLDMTAKGKKLGQIDQRFMERAEWLLHGELAVALGIPIDEVPKYIEKSSGDREPASGKDKEE